MANLQRAQEVEGGIIFDDGGGVFWDTFNPIISGFGAVEGSLFLRSNGNVYRKTGAGDTDWTQMDLAGGITVEDEGVPLTTGVSKFNFAGAGVTVTEPVTDEVLVTIPGGGGTGDLATVQARRSADFLPTAAYADITLDVTDVENDTAVLEHDDTNTEQVLIKEDGPYLISYGATIDLDDLSVTTEDTFIRILKNGTIEIPGSEAFVNAESTDDSKPYMQRTVVAELLTGDEISLQARQTSGTTSLVANTIILNVVRLKGTKGDGAANIDLPMVQIRRSTEFTITTAFTDVPMDLTDVENDTTVLEHNTTDTERVDIKETGIYFVTWKSNINAPVTIDAMNEIRGGIELNGTTLLPEAAADTTVFNDASVNGSLYEDTVSNPGFVRLFTAGDFITLQLIKAELGVTSVNTTEADETQLLVIRLKGVKGDTGPTGDTGPVGPPGAGSTILVEDEGILLATAADTLDFVGPGVVASGVGTTKTITISGGALIKTASDEVSVDTTTTASPAAPAILFSIAITPANASSLFCIFFSASGDASGGGDDNVSFQIFYGLTGSETKQRSTYFFNDAPLKEAGSCALNLRLAALGAGEHTIQIRWGVEGGETGRIRPVLDPDFDHASIIVQEVSG